jgi:hypothetical protein
MLRGCLFVASVIFPFLKHFSPLQFLSYFLVNFSVLLNVRSVPLLRTKESKNKATSTLTQLSSGFDVYIVHG